MIDEPGRAPRPGRSCRPRRRARRAACGRGGVSRVRRSTQPATQAVFGEGPGQTRVDAGRRAAGRRGGSAGRGRLSVRPAPCSIARSAAAGIDRAQRVYVTNAVKHFTFDARGKRRIHERPRATDVRRAVRGSKPNPSRAPAAIVCLAAPPRNACSVRGQHPARPRPGVSIEVGAVGPRLVPPIAVLRADEPAHSEEIYPGLSKISERRWRSPAQVHPAQVRILAPPEPRGGGRIKQGNQRTHHHPGERKAETAPSTVTIFTVPCTTK